MPQGASTRWCPTPEQVMILEEMYRNGIRTPNASEIQSITGHLSFFGKIEGKNVFYWFQNHKARERQKMRKKMNRILHNRHNETLEFHHQQGIDESISAMNLSNRKESSFLMEDVQKPIFHGHEWMTVVDVTTTTRGCRPIETLQLFPVETIKFEEENPARTI